MPAYLDLAGFKARTIMPSAEVDRLETAEPGWLLEKLTTVSSEIDDQLKKRYDAPFSLPYPKTVQSWLERIVTPDAYFKRGINASDAQYEEIKARAKDARLAVAEAADSNTGLYDLPLRQDSATTGIARGGPYAYSEASPYTFTDVQAEAVRNGR